MGKDTKESEKNVNTSASLKPENYLKLKELRKREDRSASWIINKLIEEA